jgi:hypothetical protein
MALTNLNSCSVFARAHIFPIVVDLLRDVATYPGSSGQNGKNLPGLRGTASDLKAETWLRAIPQRKRKEKWSEALRAADHSIGVIGGSIERPPPPYRAGEST